MSNNTIPTQEVQLADHHSHMLEIEMMINADIITARGYRTISEAKELQEVGFSSTSPLPGLLIPIHSTDGISEKFIFHPDNPKIKKPSRKNDEKSNNELTVSYITQKGKTIQLDCPPSVQKLLKDPNITLYITDDPIKADNLASKGLCAIAIVGIWSFIGKTNLPEIVQLPDWDHVNFSNRTVRFYIDMESKKDDQVQKVFKRLFSHLKRKKANVEWATVTPIPEPLPESPSEDPSNSMPVDPFEGSIKVSSTPPTPKPPTFRIATDEGKEIHRPLCLIGDKAYAATWQIVETITTEIVDADGQIITLDPPEIKSETKLVVICSDGTSYGGQNPIEYLGIKILLQERITAENNWGAAGINRFLKKEHPNPVIIFEQLIKVIDHFIDFHKSLADQRTMCEFISCWILATWFLDAFNVTGYLWITGERGSGKTNLLILISQLSYLGLFISQSGSFASLRDMADYGATLACDDAENITDPKRTDPDKMALLLAGNRKGLTIPIKVQGADKKWQIRYVNAYCPRAFSAIRIPDPTMASRTIILPMLRTPNKSKGNIDPMDYENWPLDRKLLIADLWSLALQKLPILPNWDKLVGKKAKLIGRNLQPWRSILAVSAWLEKCGVEGLYGKVEALSLDYQNVRPELEIADMTRIAIQALCICAISAIKANSANKNVKQVNIKVADVTDAMKKIIEEEELDFDTTYINNRKIGRILAKLRFPEAARQGGKGSRPRVIDLKDLAELAESYKVEFNDQVSSLGISSDEPLPANGTNGINGTNGTEESCQDGFQENSNLPDEPEVNCAFCGFSSFWQRSDGGWVCGTCHPNPNNQQ